MRRLSAILTTASLTVLLAASMAPIRSDAAETKANQPSPKADPVMNEELMGRLIVRTLDSKRESIIDPGLCVTFAICDGTIRAPAKQVRTTQADGYHYFVLSLKEGSKDILIIFKSTNGEVINAYLTDKSGALRAALIAGLNGVNPRLIPNDQAAEKFKDELALFAREAADLPPTGINGVSVSRPKI
jgi:hypothetical protein